MLFLKLAFTFRADRSVYRITRVSLVVDVSREFFSNVSHPSRGNDLRLHLLYFSLSFVRYPLQSNADATTPLRRDIRNRKRHTNRVTIRIERGRCMLFFIYSTEVYEFEKILEILVDKGLNAKKTFENSQGPFSVIFRYNIRSKRITILFVIFLAQRLTFAQAACN